MRQTWHLLRADAHRVHAEPALRGSVGIAARLYAAAAEVTGARLLIDSSKRPSDAALLRLLPDVEPFYLQLVRDPRAVAFSWQRRKRQHTPPLRRR